MTQAGFISTRQRTAAVLYKFGNVSCFRKEEIIKQLQIEDNIDSSRQVF